MSEHAVGVRIVGGRSMLMPGFIQAVCDTCEWEGPLHERTHKDAIDREGSRQAQREAIEHQGGTLRVSERRPRSQPQEMDEMFPGVR